MALNSDYIQKAKAARGALMKKTAATVNPPKPLVQRAAVNRAAIMSGQMTPEQQLANREKFAKQALQSSQTINRFSATTPSQVEAQQALNTKYDLPPDTGLKTTPAVTRASVLTGEQKPKQVLGTGNWINTSTLAGKKQLMSELAKNKPTSAFTSGKAFTNANTAYTTVPKKPVDQSASDYLKEVQGMTYAASENYDSPYTDVINQTSQVYTDAQKEQIKAAEERIAQLEAMKGTVLDPYTELANQQKEELRAVTAQRLLEAKQAANAAKEDQANRFAFSGFGRSSEHADAQAVLATKALNIESEINRAALLEESKIDAELRGATRGEIDSINEAIAAQQEKISGLKSDYAQKQGELRLKAIETGQTIAAQKQAALQEQAAEQMEKEAAYLKATGQVRDPRTGELVDDMFARADLLKTEAEIAKINAEAFNELNPQNKYELKYNPLTGSTDIFDPATGKIVSQNAAFGGGATGGGVQGTGAGGDKKVVNSVFYQKGKSDYGWGEGKRECGEGYNDITSGAKVGDSYASKLKTVTKQANPQVGNGLIIPIGPKANGHIETVIGVNGDTIQTVGWNRDKQGNQSIQSYSISQLQQKYGNNWGFSNSTLKPEYANKLAAVTQPTQPAASAGKTYDNYLRQGLAQGMFPKDAMEFASSMVKEDAKVQREIEKASEPLLLSDTAKDKISKVNTALDSLNSLESAINEGYEPRYVNPSTPVVGMFTGATPYEAAENLLIENIGRLQSGGAISAQEVENFKSLLPRPADDSKVRALKLQQARSFLNDKLSVYGMPENPSQQIQFSEPNRLATLAEYGKQFGNFLFQ